MRMQRTSARGKKKEEWITFKANRPFVFMINDGDFVGVYTKGKRSDPPSKIEEKVPEDLGNKNVAQ